MNQVLEMELQFILKNLKTAVQTAIGGKALNLVSILKQVESVAQAGSQHAQIVTTAVQTLDDLYNEVHKLFEDVHSSVSKNKATLPQNNSQGNSVAQADSLPQSGDSNQKSDSTAPTQKLDVKGGLTMSPVSE